MTEDLDRARALLDAQHDFPGPFLFRVVAEPHAHLAVVAALESRGGLEVTAIEDRPSRNGRWVALHVSTVAASAEALLEA